MDSTIGVPLSSMDAEIRSFFYSAPPLRDSDGIGEKLRGFIELNSAAAVNSANGNGRRIVCVTSGGTTVPLEQRCVRYMIISARTIGAQHPLRSKLKFMMYFIKAGYAVIFLYRRGTCQPYCRSLPEDPLLQCFERTDDFNIQVRDSCSEAVKKAINDHHAAVEGGHLLKLPFTTIFEYLQMLQLIATAMRDLERHTMFYLAAAVSDFYVPWKDMAEHKIQSASGPLDMRLVQVPKMLSVLRKEWAPMAFCISFKLETDSQILLKKADMALKKYKMHMVIANELLTRQEEVTVVTTNENIPVYRDKTEPGSDVEKPLIELVVGRHSTCIKGSDP